MSEYDYDNENKKKSFWVQHVKQYNKSNTSLKSYCKLFNLNINTFEYWQDILLLEKLDSQGNDLVEVSITSSSPDFIDLILPNNLKLRLTNGFNQGLLKEIILFFTGELNDN